MNILVKIVVFIMAYKVIGDMKIIKINIIELIKC